MAGIDTSGAPLALFPMQVADGDTTPTATFTGVALGTDGNIYTATGTGKWKKATSVSE